MSVINKMLRDLDRRDVGAEGGDLRAPNVVVVDDENGRGKNVRRFIFVALALVTVGFAVLYFVKAQVRSGPAHESLARPATSDVPEAVRKAQFPMKMTSELSLRVPSAVAPAASVSEDGAGRAAAASPAVEREIREAPIVHDAHVALEEKAAGRGGLSETLTVAGSKNSQPKPDMTATTAAAQAVSVPVVERTVSAAPPASLPVKQVKELSPRERAENEYRRAALLVQQARLQEAEAALEQALSLDAHHAGARQLLVGVLLDVKRNGDALKVAEEGLSQDAAQPGLAMILARLQVDRGDLQGALQTLQRSLPAGAEQADYQAFLGALMQRAGRHKEAIAHYAVAVRKSPQNGVWWMGLGISLQADGRAAEAAEAFTRAKSAGLSAELQAFVDGRLAQLQR